MENRTEENREPTQGVPVAESAKTASPRRRRGDRNRQPEVQNVPPETQNVPPEEQPSARYTEQPVLESDSETAREVARRFRMDELDGSGNGERRMPVRSASSRAGMAEASRRADPRRAPAQNSPYAAGNGHEQVGYTPGRMGLGNAARGRMSEESRARLAEENRGAFRGQGYENVRRPGPADGRGNGARDPRTGGQPGIPDREPETNRRRGRLPAALTVLFLLIGVLIIGMLLIPEDADGLPGMVKGTLIRLLKGDGARTAEVRYFNVVEPENITAPADVVFTIATGGAVEGVKLTEGNGREIGSDLKGSEESDKTLWEVTWHLDEGWEGEIWLQLLTGGTWTETGNKVELHVSDVPEEKEREEELPVVFNTPEPAPVTPEPAGEAETAGRTDQTGENPDGGRPEAEAEGVGEKSGDGTEEPGTDENVPPEDGDGPLTGDAPMDGGIDEDDLERGKTETEDETPGEKTDGEQADNGEEEPADSAPEAEEKAEDAAPGENNGPEQTGSAAEEAGTEDTETAAAEKPKLTVEAGENADPALIATTQIYNGTKKVKEYARAASDQIQMPVLGEYTRQKMGILTFRTDAFRQNASIGTVNGMNGMEVVWKAEAGFVKGTGSTSYYGVGWTGQPVIIKWSKEVREQSEMYDAKKEKTGLREVIVAGLDGRIRFLDLTDGTATRNSVKLGYPMKGTPSLHPSGAPYMTVGQFARKMASGTGTIGLRQYNLYNLKEMSLIDGLDAKNNRPFNNVGSFETSALIDRRTSTLVTAGTNGLLYVIKLNPEFDYVAGVYRQSPAQVVLRTKAKGEKDTATAVEASVAMYDRYVYYADMGGFLRCVDTNTMKTVWAVALGDSVESTPALAWRGENGLDLFTATELNTRKRGDAEIRCTDALSGEIRWTAEFGVKKDTKNKSVSGFRASPVVGQNGLDGYVYYTINNLSDEGREKLNLDGNTDAAVIALRTEDGSVAWSCGLSGRGYSSPTAVYDGSGNGAVIQCAGDGSIVMLDGLNGKEKARLQIDGAIEASPAVYNDMMVIGTTEKNKNNIYGIRIQ